ncbi:unnamed protein product [Rotaria sp. Silwood2]|nr:unnamed protein product [Rotaria sp. Silwood2]
MAQQKNTLVNNLIQSVSELTREIQHASDKVRRSHYEALETSLEWRRKQMESIEQRYISQCSSIEERFGRLMSLEQNVRNRLTTEAHEPLIGANPTDETLAIVRQTIASIYQDLWQFRWNATSKDRKASVVSTHISFNDV